MKKQILLLSAVVLSSIAMAQSSPSFSIRAGIASSDMRGDAINSLNNILDFADGMIATKSRTGFFAGASAAIPVSENISIEPGLYYTQKGYELKGELGIKAIDFLGVNAKAALNTSYIDVPLLVKGNFGGLEVFAGPQVSYLTNAELRTTAGALGFNVVDSRVDANNQFNKWDAAITGGIGYQFNGGLNIRASYDHGILKADANRNLDTYNRSLKLGIGLRF